MKYFPLLSLLLLFFLSSCSPRVTTSRPTQADLSRYSSFAYLPNADVQMARETDNEKVNAGVVSEINRKMKQQGYTLDRDNPDLLVLASVRTETEVRTDTDPVYAAYPYANSGVRTVSPYYGNYYYNGYYDYNNFVGYDTDYYKIKEGVLVISLIDRETGQTVWRGMTSDALNNQSTSAKAMDLVSNIFKEYPLEMKSR